MALSRLQAGDMAALGYDIVSGESGLLLKVQIAETIVKGELLSVSAGANNKYIKQTNEFDTCLVAAEGGASGAFIWAWTTGSICQVLYRDSTASTRGFVCVADSADGRASDVDISTIQGLPAADTHFKEVGHVKQTVTGGTNVLVLIHFHTL